MANRELIFGGVHLFEVHSAHAFAAVSDVMIDIFTVVSQPMDQITPFGGLFHEPYLNGSHGLCPP